MFPIDFYFFPQIPLSLGVSEGAKERVLVFLQSIPEYVNKFLRPRACCCGFGSIECNSFPLSLLFPLFLPLLPEV